MCRGGGAWVGLFGLNRKIYRCSVENAELFDKSAVMILDRVHS